MHSKKHDEKAWFGTSQTALKSVTSDKHVLDSALWWELSSENSQYYLDWKDVFVYNENGQVILFKYCSSFVSSWRSHMTSTSPIRSTSRILRSDMSI